MSQKNKQNNKINNTQSLTKYLIDDLSVKFPRIHWLLYPSESELLGLALPAAHLELQSFDMMQTMTDLHGVGCTYGIRLLFADEVGAQLKIRDAALVISSYVQNTYFKCDQIQSTSVISNQQDFFAPEISGYVSWEVLFVVNFYCGKTIYEENSTAPDVEIKAKPEVKA